MFIIEIHTRSGRICERFRSFARARRRIDQFKEDDLLGIPFIYEELADGSQRLVREDGKPLQWHRHEDEAIADDAPLPLSESATPPDKTSLEKS